MAYIAQPTTSVSAVSTHFSLVVFSTLLIMLSSPSASEVLNERAASLTSIEQLTQERLPSRLSVILFSISVLMLAPSLLVLLRSPHRNWRDGLLGGGTFDDLVEFTPIQPHAPTLRAVVNLDTFLLSINQRLQSSQNDVLLRHELKRPGQRVINGD